uniref:Uncharacterized protein n=1 Tax=Cohnella candidum TaxID=2674991 RepID=A0A3G3JXB5_9BACL|nr:hypothetical protein EAV92_07910 [Cohnella candidum]
MGFGINKCTKNKPKKKLKKTLICKYFKKSTTAYNIVFTHRSLAAARSARRIFKGAESGGQPCEPNRVAAAPLGLKVLGFVNTRDVIRNKCYINQKRIEELFCSFTEIKF